MNERTRVERKTTTSITQAKGETKLSLSTAYDAWMGALVDEFVDAILVGDSLAVVVQGYDTTLPVTLDEIVYHTQMVVRGTQRALIIADLPFLSYETGRDDAIRSAGRCIKEGGAQAVKLEGGRSVAETVASLTAAGIPVVGHLGVQPQAIHTLGSLEPRDDEEAASNLLADAKALEQAGIFALVLELVPASLARSVTQQLTIPTIGIGSGADCDGQIQVFHDLFQLRDSLAEGLATPFCDAGTLMRDALRHYATSVRGES